MFISAGAATALAAVTVAGAANSDNSSVVPIIAGWWVVAAAIGLWIGRRRSTTPPIARLLADSHPATSLPELRPGSVLVNRLWVLMLGSISAGALAFLAPQIPGIACGFAIIWALAWRNQEKAVTAIEERDGMSFYVERTSPFRPIELTRVPGFRRDTATV